ncbi:hypothetical protein WN943_018830 [Citrus x changshan-huyou]
MDDDNNTTFYITFKDTTHYLGVIDLDKLSRVCIIIKVLIRVYARRMTPDEKFNLSVFLTWEMKKVQIVDYHDLIVQLHEHHNIPLTPLKSIVKNLKPSEAWIVKFSSRVSLEVWTQVLQTSNPFQSSDDNGKKSKRTKPTTFIYDFDDSDYGLTKSKEKDPHHPQGAPSVINALVPPIDQANEGYVYSNDSDIDYMLSDCDSDDNEFGEDYDDETDEVCRIPCIHVMPCIVHNRKDQAHFLSSWLKKDTYIRGYSRMIHPIPDKNSWLNPNVDEILPPLMRKPPKRPRINRRREANEVPPKSKRYMMQCKGCKEFGHNRRGCLVNPENSNKRTRLYHESPSYALIVAPRHASDNIQVIVEVENIRTNNLCNAKKHKAAIQTKPSSSKNLVKRKRMEGSNDAAWVDLRGDYRRDEHKDRKKLDKGKASIFLPWRLLRTCVDLLVLQTDVILLEFVQPPL